MSRRFKLSLLLGALAALAGCATVEPHLVPAPAVFKDARLAFDKTLPVELQSTRLPVFFATTRAATEGPEHVGNDAAPLTLGIARVRLGEPGPVAQASREQRAAVPGVQAVILDAPHVAHLDGRHRRRREVGVPEGAIGDVRCQFHDLLRTRGRGHG